MKHPKKKKILIVFSLIGLLLMTLYQVQREQVYLQQAAELEEVQGRVVYTNTVNSPIVAVPGEVIVKYKQGQSPDELAEKKEEIEKENGTFVGSVSNRASDVMAALTGEVTVSEKLEKIETVANAVGVIASSPIVDPQIIEDPQLQKEAENTQVIQVSPGTSVAELANAYQALPEVVYAQPNYLFTPAFVPNDPYFIEQWDLEKIGMEQVWNTDSGTSAVRIAVIDTGIDYTSPDLEGSIIPGYSFVPGTDPNDLIDKVGHGTFIAGIIGAKVNNDYGVAGMNKNIRMVNIKLYDAPNAQMQFSQVTQAILYAIEQDIKIINFSTAVVGDFPCESMPGYQDVLNQVAARGILFVQAAGNSNSGFEEGCTNRMQVAATTKDDQRASYSDWGSDIDISAPGGAGNCQGALLCDLIGLSTRERVVYWQGTSYAAPHVSAAAALLLAKKPTLTPEELKRILIDTADPINTDHPIGPRLNVSKALAALDSVVVPEPTTDLTPTVALTSPTLQPTESVNPSIAPTQVPAVILSPTSTSIVATPTQSPPTLTPTPTHPVTPTFIAVNLSLTGIGENGNIVPLNATRDVRVQLFDKNNKKIGSDIPGRVAFEGGLFKGMVNAGTIVPSGEYTIKVKMNQSLESTIASKAAIVAGVTNTPLPQVKLAMGDINNDNTINIVDYNILVSCFTSRSFTAACNNRQIDADLNDDGIVDGIDYNLFLSGLRVKN